MGLHLHGAAREGATIILLAGCVFLLLALFSYTPADPGWSHRGPETDVDNWMGPIGAWLADVLYSLFGASALWWPGMLGYASWWMIRTRRASIDWDATAAAVRLGGLVLLLLGTTTLGALHFYSPQSVLPYSSGGILGEGLVGALVPLVDSGGTGLLALAAMLCGFPLFTGFSWFTVMDELGHRMLRLWRWAATPFGLVRERYEARHEEHEPGLGDASGTQEGQEGQEEEDAYGEPVSRRPRRWAFWRRRAVEPALAHVPREPGMSSALGADDDTRIPWDVVEQTPSAKQPEAAYTAAPNAPGGAATPPRGSVATPAVPPSAAEGAAAAATIAAAGAASGSLKASRHEEPTPAVAMPLRATPDDEAPAATANPGPASEAPRPPEMREPPLAAPAAAEQPPRGPSGTQAAGGKVTPARREPELSAWQPAEPEDSHEPRLSWKDVGAAADESASTEPASPSSPTPEPQIVEAPGEEAPTAPLAGDQASGLRAWRETPGQPSSDPLATPHQPEASPEREPDPQPQPQPEPESGPSLAPPVSAAMAEPPLPPSIATAEQARAAAAEPEGPTLWTVEHLQSQRPVLDDMPEPDGELPSLRLLTPPEPHQQNYTEQQLADMAELLETRLREYGVKAEVVSTWPGPVITRFEIKPAAGVKVSKISNLAKDLARSLMVKSVRVVEVIPGRPTVGIEIPNPHRAMIRLREVVDSDRYQQEGSALTLALGQDIGGGPVVANLGKMPHLLVAGTTGSGKSVGVNAMLISMLLKATPDDLRLIMVDPKMLELSVYDGIPHLLAPVVTDMKEAANALRWCVAEMERRYKLMAAMGVRNIAGFNGKLDEAERAGAQVADPLWEPQPWEMHEPPPVLEKLPYIVVVIDEFADMFMIVGKKVEELIARLAQKARAAGIHLILATQRPSVDVVTGLIKANIPTRMAFQVSSKVDSRTILDQGGAENLLGHGDMLYLPAGSGLPTRVHGAFVDDDEVHRVVEDWKRRGEPEYVDEILSGGVSADALTGLEADAGEGGGDAEQDALYDEAVQFVTDSRRASISAVQRRFKIGYNRAARLVEAMEAAGVVSSMGSNGGREVLAPPPVGH